MSAAALFTRQEDFVFVRQELERMRAGRVSFERAWTFALRTLRRQYLANGRGLARGAVDQWESTISALHWAREAFRRAYELEPPTREDIVAARLLLALERLEGEAVEPETYLTLMEAA